MAKYTDEQIKKALEKCKKGDCRDCLIVNECCPSMNLPIFDLINRQEAEIERLQREIHSLEELIETKTALFTDVNYSLLTAKSEAIKEFLEILETKKQWDVDIPDYVFFDDIINITKGMVGESK